MACSNIRYGPGVTQEVGMDLINLGAKHVGVYTDKNLAGNTFMKIFFFKYNELKKTSSISFLAHSVLPVLR